MSCSFPRYELLFFDAIKRWLSDRPHWPLVSGQIEDMTLFDLIVPPRSNGRILLTMRTQNTWKRAHDIFIPLMDTDAAALLLLRRAQTLSAQATLKQASEVYKN